MVFVVGFPYRLRSRPGRARRRREVARSYECVSLAEEIIDLCGGQSKSRLRSENKRMIPLDVASSDLAFRHHLRPYRKRVDDGLDCRRVTMKIHHGEDTPRREIHRDWRRFRIHLDPAGAAERMRLPRRQLWLCRNRYGARLSIIG